ncbi:unnamed protein product [Caenorhabditis nigoni]
MPKRPASFYDGLVNTIKFPPWTSNSPAKKGVNVAKRVEDETMRMGRQTLRRSDHIEYTDYEDEQEEEGPIRRSVHPQPQRSVHPQPPQRWIRSPTASTSSRGVAAQRVPQPTPMSRVLYRGYRVLTDQVALHRNEIDYITRIDETAPMLNNLLNCINESVIDIGKCGLVILKYKQSDRFDEHIYNESAKSLSAFELHTLSDGTCLGNLSSQVFQYGQIFYIKILQLRQSRSRTRSTSVKVPKPPASLSASPTFVHVTRVFNGKYPFKVQEIVSTQEMGPIPADPRRAISSLIKHVLSQIFDGEKVHQKFAIRTHHGRNKKNDDLQDLPRDVVCFIKEFCLSAFGYPPKSQYAHFTYDDLERENSDLIAELGNTREERMSNFPRFQRDVQNFMMVVMEKIQRLMHDLRPTTLRIVDEETSVREFVHDQTYKNRKKKHVEEPEPVEFVDFQQMDGAQMGQFSEQFGLSPTKTFTR